MLNMFRDPDEFSIVFNTLKIQLVDHQNVLEKLVVTLLSSQLQKQKASIALLEFLFGTTNSEIVWKCFKCIYELDIRVFAIALE